MFAIIGVLVTAAFFYVSAVPLVFGVPDFRARLVGMIAPPPWQSGRAFDWIVNILALIPLGFFWSGAIAGRATTASTWSRVFCRVAMGCLVVAALAESLQFWMPLRVPSLRDIIALETGAIVGCSLWRILGARTTTICSLLLQRLSSWRVIQPWAMKKWMVLFGLLLAACLTINTWASPSKCFEMYRHRTFSPKRTSARGHVAFGSALLLSSTLTALVLLGVCRLGVRRLDRPRVSLAHGLPTFVENSSSGPDFSIADHRVPNERIDGELSGRAA